MTCAASFLRSIHRSLIAVVFIAGASGQASAGDVHLLWDPNSEPDLAGYVLLYGTASGVYTQSMEFGPSTTEAAVSGLPAGVTYYFAVRAFNAAGQQSALSNEVSVSFAAPPVAPPLVTTVAPASGTTAGQQQVTIDGTGFQTGLTVRFGATFGLVESVTPTRIVVRTPAASAGVVAITVANPDGQSTVKANAYTFAPPTPTVTSFSPTSAATTGGTTVTIVGTQFTAGLSVRFGSASATVTSVTTTTIVAVVPSLPPGPVPVTVTLSNGQIATAPGSFTAVAPQPSINAVAPAWGWTAGGTAITITGSNFLAGATVLFGSTPAVVTSLTATIITATAPAHFAGPVSVLVVNPGGGLASKVNAFTYVAQAPVVTSVAPSRGPVVGGNTVTIFGQNFGPGTEVTFDGVAAPVQSVSPAMLTVRVPARPMGAATVTVRNPDGRSAQAASAYHFDAASPSISGLTPGDGPVEGGTLVSITGTNFVSGVQVRFGGVAAQVVTVNASEIFVFTPPHNAGRVDVTVVNPGGLEVSLGEAFRYDEPTTEHTFTRYFAEGVLGTFFDTRFALANPHEEPVDVRATFTDPFGQETVKEFVVAAGSRFTLDRSNMPALANDAFGSRFEASREIGIDRTVMWDPAQPYGAHSETGIEAPRTEWYLAEGATHSGFNLFYLLQNPSNTVAEVLVRYMLGSGQVIERVHFVGPRARTNIWVNKDDPALEAAEISAHLVSVNDVPIVVERSMYLNRGGQLFTAGHNSGGVNEPATRWFLAEGATGTYFDTFILVANPGNTPAKVTVTYLLPSGAPLVLPYTVPGQSRFTIWVDQEHATLAATDFSAIVESTNGVPLIVERSMWWPDRPGGQWTEAHNSAGATTTASRWILADGTSSTVNQAATYALVANTSPAATTVRFTLLGEAGTVRSVEETVGANARFSVDVAGVFPEALNTRFSLLVESVEGAPLVVERASYWNAGSIKWSAGTNSLAMPLKHAAGVRLAPMLAN